MDQDERNGTPENKNNPKYGWYMDQERLVEVLTNATLRFDTQTNQLIKQLCENPSQSKEELIKSGKASASLELLLLQTTNFNAKNLPIEQLFKVHKTALEKKYEYVSGKTLINIRNFYMLDLWNIHNIPIEKPPLAFFEHKSVISSLFEVLVSAQEADCLSKNKEAVDKYSGPVLLAILNIWMDFNDQIRTFHGTRSIPNHSKNFFIHQLLESNKQFFAEPNTKKSAEDYADFMFEKMNPHIPIPIKGREEA